LVNFLSAFDLASLNVRPAAASDEGWRGGCALNPGGVVPTDTAHQRQMNMGPGRPQAPATTPPAPGTTPTP
jgi:hypothetical protein